MRHYLVIAHRTLGGTRLMEHLHGLREDDPYCRFHLVVPKRHKAVGASHPEDERAQAQAVLDEVLDRMASMGMGATGTVGDFNPVLATGDAVRRYGKDDIAGIIVSTLPKRTSAWLRSGVPERIAQRWPNIQVVHVVAEEALV